MNSAKVHADRPAYGLIVEEVHAVYPDLVAHSADGEVETVQYQKINAMLRMKCRSSIGPCKNTSRA